MNNNRPKREVSTEGMNNPACDTAMSASSKQALVTLFELLIATDQKQRKKKCGNRELEQE